MRARLGDSVSGRYRLVENSLLTKHVVAAGSFAKDAGSTPAASTIFCWGFEVSADLPGKQRLPGPLDGKCSNNDRPPWDSAAPNAPRPALGFQLTPWSQKGLKHRNGARWRIRPAGIRLATSLIRPHFQLSSKHFELLSRTRLARLGTSKIMQWIAPSEKDTATETLEKRLWDAADQFRANSGLKAQEYSAPVLGLIFLRFAEVRFAARRAKSKAEFDVLGQISLR